MFALEAITGLLGVLIPPVSKMIRNVFGKKEDDPEEMAGILAQDKPEVLPVYIQALAGLYTARKEYFNRDIVDADIWKWVKSVRALIRPLTIVGCLILLVMAYAGQLDVDQNSRATMTMWIGSWMGDRIDV